MWAMTRSPLLLLAIGAALTLGACGSSDDNGGSGSSAKGQDDKAFEGALKYAKCMREHGIDMPDPQRVGSGGIKQTMKGKPGSRAKMDAANKDCQKYMQIGGGRAPSAAEQAKAKDAMLAYAKCMRDNGVDMPDPKFSNSGGGVTFQLGGPGNKGGSTGGPNPDSPTFKAADKVCHSKLADLEKGGPGGDGGPSTSSSGGDEG
jgi:hypothetical protein